MPRAYQPSPRTRAEYLSDDDIASLRAYFDNGDSSRVAAAGIMCSSRTASKYYNFFRCENRGKPVELPPKPKTLDREAAAQHYAARHYKSNFEPS